MKRCWREGATCISRQDAHGTPFWDAQSTLKALRCYSGIKTSLISFNPGNLSFLNVFSQRNSSLGFFRFCYFLTKSPRSQNLKDAILAHVSKSFAPQQGWEGGAGGGRGKGERLAAPRADWLGHRPGLGVEGWGEEVGLWGAITSWCCKHRGRLGTSHMSPQRLRALCTGTAHRRSARGRCRSGPPCPGMC